MVAAQQGFGVGLLVGDSDARLSLLKPAARAWSSLRVPGTQPAFSPAGDAIYAFQRVASSRVIAVIALPPGLQVRIFPVSLEAVRMSAAPDGTLAIFERSAKTADVRFIACSSRLLAVAPRYKHGTFFGGGVPWQLVGLATPDPQETEWPTPSGGVEMGCR
jgi:hypothetical protein